MFCNNCGSEIPNGQNFCSKCGAKVGTNQNYQQPAQQIIVQTQAAPVPTNGCATAGFVLALLGFLFFETLLVPIIALILSFVGLVRAKKADGTGRGLAIVGMILSFIELIPAIVVIVIIVGLFTAAAGAASSMAAPLLLLAI